MKAYGILFSLGFMKIDPDMAVRYCTLVRTTGGSLRFVDPKADVAYAYVTNQMGTATDWRPTGSRAPKRALLG